jgi:hypothetical protein
MAKPKRLARATALQPAHQPTGARTATTTARQPAIMSPAIDTLCIGGLFIGIAGYALVGQVASPAQRTSAMLLIGIFLNAPHFMASYRLLYGSAERWGSYFSASVIIPALLVVYAAVGMLTYQQQPAILTSLVAAAGLLLAWHWTGQTWGMISVYSTMDNRLINTLERRLLRTNLYVLMIWHIVWVSVIVVKLFAPNSSSSMSLMLDSAAAHRLYQQVSILAALSAPLGAAGYLLFWKRTGKLPTIRMVVPWISVHMGYVWLYLDPAAFFWVQNFMHALQYLIFPMRVEINRTRQHPSRSQHITRHMLVYYAGAVIVGLLTLEFIPGMAAHLISSIGQPVQLALVACINLHHYFIDNAVWKLKSKHVRVQLLSHLRTYVGRAA